MNPKRALAKCTAAALAIVLALPAAASDSLLAEMNTAKSKAHSYEFSENFTFAYRELTEYADLAETLAEAGVVTEREAALAAAHRDILRFDPELYISESAGRGIFAGSDGYFADGADAVKLSIPFGEAQINDYLHLIPQTVRELCILVTFEVTTEGVMRNITFGKYDDYLAQSLRQLSLIEGRVHLAFCPAVNTMRRTGTIAQSYISAYRYVANAARRYAPNVSLVYSLEDVLVAGEDTAALFYPGDGYVDVLGVELCNTYNKSEMPSSEAAFDRRGGYYDPVYSVRLMADKLTAAAGDLPVMVTGCSFPWDGRAAVTDFAAQMERFYHLVPLVCPNLAAVFYSNESSAYGVCNLRQNAEAAQTYEKCLSLPWYDDAKGAAFGDGSVVEAGATVPMILYCGGRFAGAEYEVWQNGEAVSADAVTLAEGDLTVHITDERCLAKLEYRLVPAGTGMLRVEAVPPELDYNGNGYLDFGDSDLLTAYIAKWDVDLGGAETDLNGDGKTNIMDVRALLKMIAW